MSPQESRFVRDLRNFILHVDPPAISPRFRWSRAEGERREFLLDRDRLETWDGWSPRAREYLAPTSDDISVEPLTTSYTSKVHLLYLWFGELNRRHHAEAFREFDALEAKVRETILDGGLVDPKDEETRIRSADELVPVVEQLRAVRIKQGPRRPSA